MDNQATQDNSGNLLTSVNDMSLSSQTRVSLFIPILSATLVSGIVFGVAGYYFGRQNPVADDERRAVTSERALMTPSVTATITPSVSLTPTITPSVSPSNSPSPTITPSVSPTVSISSSIKLTYNLPSSWKVISDINGRLSVGYDSTKYDASARTNQVDLSGKFVGTQGVDMRRLGGNKSFYFSTYDGGSRHAELFKILGVSSGQSDWKSPKYSEREYSYNGWKCLLINGVNISQYPVSWGYCPISGNEALVFAFDGYSWSEIEQQMSAVRILK